MAGWVYVQLNGRLGQTYYFHIAFGEAFIASCSVNQSYLGLRGSWWLVEGEEWGGVWGNRVQINGIDHIGLAWKIGTIPDC